MWNRPVVVALVVALVSSVVARPARADGPASPRLAALAAEIAARHRGAEDAFWKQVADEGTPLIEDTHDAKGRLLVTFVYRARRDTRVVAMYGAPDGAAAGYAQLERLPGTGVFAHSALVDPAARFSYHFAPGDSFGPRTQDAALVTEADVNEIGYALLAHQRDQDAIALFEWNLQRFPRSWNAHDSLADGYRHVGDRARAIASYKRSLELNPKNDNARMMIEVLR